MARALVDDNRWHEVIPLCAPPKPRRFRFPGRQHLCHPQRSSHSVVCLALLLVLSLGSLSCVAAQEKVLRSSELFSGEHALPPGSLNSEVTWEQVQTQDAGPTLVFSLLKKVTAKRASPWVLGVLLDSTHDEGDGVGTYHYIVNRGKGWSAANHIDLLHYGEGTSIGQNIEPQRYSLLGRMTGINIQPRYGWVDEGINFQTRDGGGYGTGIRFEGGVTGKRAIWIEGDFETGIDMGPNDMRLQPGARLYFGEVFFTFNEATKALEVRKGEKVLWTIDAQ